MALEELIVLVIVLALVAMFALANKSVFSYFGNTTLMTVNIQTNKYYDGIDTLVKELNKRNLISYTNDEILFTSSTDKKLGGNDVVVSSTLPKFVTMKYNNRDSKGAIWNTSTTVSTRASKFEQMIPVKNVPVFVPGKTSVDDGVFVIVTKKITSELANRVDALNMDGIGFFQKPFKFIYAIADSYLVPSDSVCVYSKSKNFCTKTSIFPTKSSMGIFQLMRNNGMLEDFPLNDGDFIVLTKIFDSAFANLVNALNTDGRGFFQKPVRFYYGYLNSIPSDSVCVYSKSKNLCTKSMDFPMQSSMSVLQFMHKNAMFGDAVHPPSPGQNVIDCDNIPPISNTPPSVEMCDEKKYHCYMLRTTAGKNKNQCMANKNRLEAVRNVYNDTMQSNFLRSPNTQKPFRFYGALDNSVDDRDTRVFSTIDRTGMVVFETYNDIDKKKFEEMSGHITSYLGRAATSGNQEYI